MGVNGPTPRPFWGNAREFAKVNSVRVCVCVCARARDRHGPCGIVNLNNWLRKGLRFLVLD